MRSICPKQRPAGSVYWYDGPLAPRGMEKEAQRAYDCYRRQKGRCYTKCTYAYKWTGARGIHVKYLAREFIGWWLKEIVGKNFKRASISRIDHDGHYEFGNIKIEEMSDNLKERNERAALPSPPKSVVIFDYKTMEPLVISASLTEASRHTGVHLTGVWQICQKNKYKSSRGFTFRYLDEYPQWKDRLACNP